MEKMAISCPHEFNQGWLESLLGFPKRAGQGEAYEEGYLTREETGDIPVFIMKKMVELGQIQLEKP